MTEEERLKKILESEERRRKVVENFWDLEYPKKSIQEKIAFWSGSLYSQMRWNGESGFDEMAVFSKSNYLYWKSREPDFDSLLPFIIKKLGPWVSEEEVYKKIKGE